MSKNKGEVYLIGAGPGDPELITLKGVAKLGLADVVLYDRLVNSAILQHAPNHAEYILVGKQGYGPSTLQSDINQLLVKFALLGKIVVRLKGGDVSFFSNILDELEVLTENNIAYEIIPGVTAASGCAAYTGIPLTARQLSDEVHILSIHNTCNYTTADWAYIAGLRGTIVLYMSASNLLEITNELIAQHVDDRKLILIEQGTLPNQKQYLSSLHQVKHDFADKKFASPALVIIGAVVELHEKFSWMAQNTEHS